jgi:hypothetical protein
LFNSRHDNGHEEALSVMMAPELEQLLDEGLENPEHVKATDELRR